MSAIIKPNFFNIDQRGSEASAVQCCLLHRGTTISLRSMLLTNSNAVMNNAT